MYLNYQMEEFQISNEAFVIYLLSYLVTSCSAQKPIGQSILEISCSQSINCIKCSRPLLRGVAFDHSE